jgi:DNA polymerase-3 subunit epsilon
VRWVLDPRQVYVVVDVETTGGRGEQHRVTEIGAVKVRDGQVLDRFQTLLNPQRSIPPGISRLTGITPAMVADAPAFTDVADEFEAFLEGAIFVAHNVEFDYGFLAREYARLGRRFRYPKLCTCASMRRLYPGHRSYSLAALCRQFDIPLRQHHRALCDAEAAAELLLLVNERRPVQ